MKRWGLIGGAVAIVALLAMVANYWLTPTGPSAPSIPRGSRALQIDGDVMAPTIKSGDVFVVSPIAESALKRGVIVAIVQPDGQMGVFRIAGIPGDRIEIRGGVVSINGEACPQTPLGTDKSGRGRDLTVLTEQFPGEAGMHRVTADGGDMPPLLVAPKRLFLLGDDRSGRRDGRFINMGGPDTVRFKHLRGQVSAIVTAVDGRSIGKSIDLPAPANAK